LRDRRWGRCVPWMDSPRAAAAAPFPHEPSETKTSMFYLMPVKVVKSARAAPITAFIKTNLQRLGDARAPAILIWARDVW
jgi:hypothetical protein